MHEDANLLTRVDLSKGWAQYLLKRMGYVKRKATSKAKVTVDNFAEIKADFLDVSVNKAVKNQLWTQFQSWYVQQVCHQHQEGEEKKPIDLRS